MSIRLTPPWRTASAVPSRARRAGRARGGRGRAPPRATRRRGSAAASSFTASAPTNAASSSSGGIASSLPPRHSANSGQRSTSCPGATIPAVSAVGQVARDDEVELDACELLARRPPPARARAASAAPPRVDRPAALADVRHVRVPPQIETAPHSSTWRGSGNWSRPASAPPAPSGARPRSPHVACPDPAGELPVLFVGASSPRAPVRDPEPVIATIVGGASRRWSSRIGRISDCRNSRTASASSCGVGRSC